VISADRTTAPPISFFADTFESSVGLVDSLRLDAEVLFGVKQSVNSGSGQSFNALVVSLQEQSSVFQDWESSGVRGLGSVSDGVKLVRRERRAGGEVSDGDLGVGEVEFLSSVESDDGNIIR